MISVLRLGVEHELGAEPKSIDQVVGARSDAIVVKLCKRLTLAILVSIAPLHDIRKVDHGEPDPEIGVREHFGVMTAERLAREAPRFMAAHAARGRTVAQTGAPVPWQAP